MDITEALGQLDHLKVMYKNAAADRLRLTQRCHSFRLAFRLIAELDSSEAKQIAIDALEADK